MNSRSISKAYQEFYFSHNCGRPYQRDEEWMRFFGSVAERIVRDIGPGTVLDAGCAMGFLVETLRARGVDAVGVDISEYAVAKAHEDVRPYCRVGSVTDALPRRYDLIVCIEVLEHLSPSEADEAIENFCRHSDDILFSSTPFDYKEATHLNVQPPPYWAQRFAQHGFLRDLDFDATFLTPWAMRFRKTYDPAWRIVFDYERRLWQLEKEVHGRRELTIEQLHMLTEEQQKIRALTEEAAAKEQAVEALTAEAAKHQEAMTAEAAKHQESVEALTAALTKEQERAQELLRQDSERLQTISRLSAQLSEQHEKLDSVVAPLVARMASTEQTVEALRAELDAKRAELAAAREELASSRAELASAREGLAEKEKAEENFESRLAQAGAAAETLSARVEEKEESLRALSAEMRALSAELAERDRVIETLKSRARGAELTISALSRRRDEQESAYERLKAEHEQELGRWAALLAYKDARLADVDSSMVWYLYNRIKYPHLLALYRLYERVKHPHLMSVYRRLGLAARTPAAQLTEADAAQEDVASAEHAVFPVREIASPQAVPPHSASVDVIVCVHNALEDVRRCLESVVRYTRMPYSLIIVDDGSDGETRAYLASFAESQGAQLIRNEEARGYTLAANQGLRRSRGDYAVLLNSDTLVTPLWLDRMVACGESDPRIGLVGPLSNVASWQSIPEIFSNGDWAENKLPDGFTAADMGKLLNAYSARLHPRIPFLNGFCLMIKRGVVEQLGYFDEAAFGRGYGEENDYCLRARSAGWELCVADDAYVYHAQSRSYSHERRKELSRHADAALAAKHDPQAIRDGVARCRSDRVLEGVRARGRVMFERERLVEEGASLWEGRRVAFILTIRSACGGGNVVIDEAAAMRRMGVDARILNLGRNREEFERAYPDSPVPFEYAEDESRVAEMAADYDAVVATANDTVYWLKTPPGAAGRPVKAYYVQDFEPYFSSPELPGFTVAWNSYTEHADLIPFTKTEWNCRAVRDNTGVQCSVVGPSVNVDLYRPRRRYDPDWPVRPLRVAAMIRPSTPRRNPRLTMEVLREFHQLHKETVEIILFGCESSDPDFLALPHDFAWRNAGMLTRSQTAALLNEVDVFADFSEFQAMGLTAMEAMACGAAVIVPQKGGADSFAVHNQNSLVVDTSRKEDCLMTLEQMTMDEALRSRLQQQAIGDICNHYQERAAYNILNVLFPASR